MLRPNASDTEIRAANRFLQNLGFEPDKASERRNPGWYRCVFISIVAKSGTQAQIEENARYVAKVLGLRIKQAKGSNPNLHFAYPEVRNYFNGRNTRRIDANHTFDDLEPYCSTHGRSYAEAEYRSDPCKFSCNYGFKYQGRSTSEVIPSFGA